MSDKSHIEWTEATWNPVTGCTKVSQGCKHCYAERDWKRLSANPTAKAYFGRKFTDVQCHPERLDQPLRWTKPRRIFVNSMSDLFHPDVPFEFIDWVFGIMSLAPQHTFQVLTKRPERMREYFNYLGDDPEGHIHLAMMECSAPMPSWTEAWDTEEGPPTSDQWPLPNVWLGVSVEDQATAEERIPLLLKTPAALRFLSCEPLLGPVRLTALRREEKYPSSEDPVWIFCDNALTGFKAHKMGGWYEDKIDWVIAGGESGPRARPIHPDWVRSLRDQCVSAGVPFFFKQWGEWQIASDHNGHIGSVMPDTGERYTWAGKNGKTYNPSAPTDQDCYAMAKVGKKRAGRILDGRTWDEVPA